MLDNDVEKTISHTHTLNGRQAAALVISNFVFQVFHNALLGSHHVSSEYEI